MFKCGIALNAVVRILLEVLGWNAVPIHVFSARELCVVQVGAEQPPSRMGFPHAGGPILIQEVEDKAGDNKKGVSRPAAKANQIVRPASGDSTVKPNGAWDFGPPSLVRERSTTEPDLASTAPSTADAQAIISVKDRVAKLEAQVTNIQEEQKGVKMEVTGVRQENKSNVADTLAAMAATACPECIPLKAMASSLSLSRL